MPETVEDLGKKVKAKFPGVYDDIPEVELGQKVRAKHPEYSDFVDLSPKQTREYLQKRYGKQMEDKGSVTGQVLKGAGKTLVKDASGMLGPISAGMDLAADIRGKDPRSKLEPQGPGEEAGSTLATGAELLLPGPKLGAKALSRAGTAAKEAVTAPGLNGRVQKGIQFIRHPIKTTVLKGLEQIFPEAEKVAVEKRPGLKGPKYGGAYNPEIEAAPGTRVPRGKFTPPPEAPPVKTEPFKTSARTAKLTKSGGPPKPFDEGASRLPPKASAPRATAADALPGPGKKSPASEPKVSIRGEAEHAVNRSDAASNVAKELKRQGLTLEGFDTLLEKDPDSLHTLAKQLGHKEVSHPGTDLGTWHQVRARLKRMLKE